MKLCEELQNHFDMRNVKPFCFVHYCVAFWLQILHDNDTCLLICKVALRRRNGMILRILQNFVNGWFQLGIEVRLCAEKEGLEY